MKTVSVAIIAMLAASTAAGAASLTNNDTSAYTVVVTEGGIKTEMSISAGETVRFCNDGCFLTLPNGDRAALGGAEKVEIDKGEAVFK